MDIGGSSPSGLSQAAVEALIGAYPINILSQGLGERLYCQRPANQMSVGALSVLQNTLYALPIWIPRGITINQLSSKVTALWAGGTFYLALYKNSGVGTVYPGARVAVSAALDGASTGWKGHAISPAVALDAGQYWFGFNCSNTANQFSAVASASNNDWSLPVGFNKTEYDAGTPWRTQIYVAMVFAQPPDPFPAGAAPVQATSVPLIAYRRSA